MRKYMPRRPPGRPRGDLRWSTFLRNQATAILACDFFVAVTATFRMVRPARAHSCGCKSRRKLITANEVKRNCMRATECGEEAWSVNREPMNKNRIEGAAKQGEWA